MYGPLEVAHATALAVTGQYARAQEIMRARISSMRVHGEYACLVLQYQYYARMALHVGDRAGYDEALRAMRDVALVSGLPAVVLMADRVAELRTRHRDSPLPATTPSHADALRKREQASEAQTAVTEFLQRNQPGEQRSQAALWFLAHYTYCEEAHLFRRQGDALQLVASLPERSHTLELERALATHLSLPQNDSVIVVRAASASDAAAEKSFRVMWLRARSSGAVTGAVVLREGSETLREVSEGMLAELALVLAEETS
jgi:hypothetical protein